MEGAVRPLLRVRVLLELGRARRHSQGPLLLRPQPSRMPPGEVWARGLGGCVQVLSPCSSLPSASEEALSTGAQVWVHPPLAALRPQGCVALATGLGMVRAAWLSRQPSRWEHLAGRMDLCWGWKASLATKQISFFSASFEGGLFPHCRCRGDAPLEFFSLNVPPLPPGDSGKHIGGSGVLLHSVVFWVLFLLYYLARPIHVFIGRLNPT